MTWTCFADRRPEHSAAIELTIFYTKVFYSQILGLHKLCLNKCPATSMKQDYEEEWAKRHSQQP